MRWTESKAKRFQALRDAEARRKLIDVERVELRALLSDLDDDEADALRPTIERMHAQAVEMAEKTARLDAKARELLQVAEDEERLLTEAYACLDRLR